MAPPITDSALIGMPAADSATSSPTSSRIARVALAAILRAEMSLPATPLSNCASMVADSHSISSNTAMALSAPCTRISSDMLAPPMRHCTPSISSTSSGSTPVSHSTSPPQTSQDTLRSSRRTSIDVGKAVCSTCTVRRISTRLVRIGTASRSRPTGNRPLNTHPVSTPTHRATSGNSTPS